MIEDVSAPLLPLSLFFLLTQKQQKHLQAVLSRLSQQDEQRVEAQQSLGKQLRSEAQRHGSLVQQLQQMVAERETKVKELEQEIQTLALKVNTYPNLIHFTNGGTQRRSHAPPKLMLIVSL